MRVAIFAETFLPKVDGVATTLCYLLDYLADHGHASLMFAPMGAPERYANTPIIGLPRFSFPFYRDLKLVRPWPRVMRPLRSFGADVVHLANPAILGLAGLRHARALEVPVVASYHTDLPGYCATYGMPIFRDPMWSFFRWIHNQADLNLCPSEFTRQQIEAHGFKRVSLWRQGVDIDRFNPRYADRGWREKMSGGRPDAPLLLYVGRLASEKRLAWLRPVLDALPQARLCIVGDGPVRGDLEKRFAGTPTVFTGYLRGADLSHAYASADIFAFPSDSETFGSVVLEAMASGLPVVAPDTGGQVDHVHHGQNGLIFESIQRDALIRCVQKLVEDSALCRHLGQKARAYALTQQWDEIMEHLLADYAAVMEQKPRTSSRYTLFSRRRLRPHRIRRSLGHTRSIRPRSWM